MNKEVKEFYTQAEIARAVGKTGVAVSLRARREGWLFKKDESSRPGRPRQLYPLALLPQAIREALETGRYKEEPGKWRAPVTPEDLKRLREVRACLMRRGLSLAAVGREAGVTREAIRQGIVSGRLSQGNLEALRANGVPEKLLVVNR